MLNDAKMRNNGDGTVSFEFTMNADEYSEIAALRKLMVNYEGCIQAICDRYSLKCHCCEMCGKVATVTSVRYMVDGSMEGPIYLCGECKGVMR